jgi:hypothetical protein
VFVRRVQVVGSQVVMDVTTPFSRSCRRADLQQWSLLIVHPADERDELALRVLDEAVDQFHHRARPHRRAAPAVAARPHLVVEQQPTDDDHQIGNQLARC